VSGHRNLRASSAAAALLLTLTGCQSPPATAGNRAPNVLVLYVDDMGWNDLGCYGNDYHLTPAIDALCRAGMRFTSAYAPAPVCAPSRASLLTGRDVLGHGIYCVNEPERGHAEARAFESPPNRTRLPLTIPTMADVLQAAGYRTGCYGKWHLGHDGVDVSPWHPRNRGFEQAIQTRSPSGKRRYFYPDFSTIPAVPIAPGRHISDFVTDAAIDFLSRQDERPFFLFVPYFSVHGPRQAKPQTLQAFAERQPRRASDDPVFGAMHADLDAAIARLLTHLRELGLEDDTLVVFTSDNGANRRYDNAPLRQGKGWLYEGGIRVPMIVRWPGEVDAGGDCDAPVSAIDLLPTLCQIAGAETPADCDGLDLSALLRDGDATAFWSRELAWHYPVYGLYRDDGFRKGPMSAVRRGRFKLLYHYESDRVELFDVVADPAEAHDLAPQQPELTQQMRGRLMAWLATNPAMLPSPRPDAARLR